MTASTTTRAAAPRSRGARIAAAVAIGFAILLGAVGGALGIALGIVLASLLVARIAFVVFSLPAASLIGFAIGAIVVGIVAAIFPARRASRLNVLEALQYE